MVANVLELQHQVITYLLLNRRHRQLGAAVASCTVGPQVSVVRR